MWHSIDQLVVCDSGEVSAILSDVRMFRIDEMGNCDMTKKEHGYSTFVGRNCMIAATCFTIKPGTDEADLKMTMSDAVTKHFVRSRFSDDVVFAEFVRVLVAAMENVLTHACGLSGQRYGHDVLFVFKGGNALRLITKMSFPELCDPASIDDWADVLGLGDMDFEIYVRDASDPRLMDKVRTAALYVLHSFAEYVAARGWTIKPGEEYHDSQMKPVASKDSVVDVFPRGGDTCNAVHVPVASTMRRRTPQGKWEWHRPPNPTGLTTSINNAISLTFPGADLTLLRLRQVINFAQQKHERVMVDIVDISIASNADRLHAMKHALPDIKWYHRYVLDEGRLHVFAPSLANIVFDLLAVIFTVRRSPWDDPKLDKRITRFAWTATLLRAESHRTRKALQQDLTAAIDALNGRTPSTVEFPWSTLMELMDWTDARTPQLVAKFSTALKRMSGELGRMIRSYSDPGRVARLYKYGM